MTEHWPDEALAQQAGSIGPALLELIDSEVRWVHRRVERIELLNATQLTRSVSTDFTVPSALENRLGLHQRESDRGTKQATRYVVPLGILPKGPLQDITITPSDVYRLTADQTNPLVVAALTPYARQAAGSPREVLTVAQEIVRSETAHAELLERFESLMDGHDSAGQRLRRLVRTLDAAYILLVAVRTDPGVPNRVSYTHRQSVEARTGAVNDPPLIIEPPLPYASGPGPAYRVEVVAPDGLEVETASLIALSDGARPAVAWEDTAASGGAFVHLRAPDGSQRPGATGLRVVFGWQSGGVHEIGAIAGLISTCALLVATIASFALGAKLKGSSAGTLLAAPALVTSLVLGFATTRVTSKAVNRLRFATLWVALLGVSGALAVSLLGESTVRLDALRIILVVCTVFSALITSAYPVPAAMRSRART
jgi:hypothetical protein